MTRKHLGIDDFRAAPRFSAVQSYTSGTPGTFAISANGGRICFFNGAAGSDAVLPAAAAGMEFYLIIADLSDPLTINRTGADVFKLGAHVANLTTFTLQPGQRALFTALIGGRWDVAIIEGRGGSAEYPASAIAFTPTGNLVSTDVQAAIGEAAIAGFLVGESRTYHGLTLPGTGWYWEDGVPISRTTFSALLDVIAPQEALNTTNASTTLTNVDAALVNQLRVGCPVEGPGIPVGATVTGFPSATSVSISLAATATAAITARFFPHGNAREVTNGGTTIGSNVVTIADGRARGRLAAGMTVTGTGIPAGTTIATVTATGITLSANATNTATSTLTFADATKFNRPDARSVFDAGQGRMGGTDHVPSASGELDPTTYRGYALRAGASEVTLTAAQSGLPGHGHPGSSIAMNTLNLEHGHNETRANLVNHQHGNPNTNLSTAWGGVATGTAQNRAAAQHDHSQGLTGFVNNVSGYAYGPETYATGGVNDGNNADGVWNVTPSGTPTIANVAAANASSPHSNVPPVRIVNKIVYAGV